MKYCFYVKPNVDYTKYGFRYDGYDNCYKLWRKTWRMRIKKPSMSLSFNIVTAEVLKIFMDMIVDGVVVAKKERKND